MVHILTPEDQVANNAREESIYKAIEHGAATNPGFAIAWILIQIRSELADLAEQAYDISDLLRNMPDRE